MRRFFQLCLTAALMLGLSSSLSAKSDFLKEFQSNYGILDQDLLNNLGEVAQITNFTYTKDVATFTFEEGSFYLLRYVMDRPTTAIFIGKGSVTIEIPPLAERNSLACATKNDQPLSGTISEQFEVCLIRMSDDFDLALQASFQFTEAELGWKEFNAAKRAQSELFFKPVVEHRYDNYFQLLRSAYARQADGYFWIDFNRYNFCFDPNRPEEVEIAYEFEGGDRVAVSGASFQRKEKSRYEDSLLSTFDYPTTIINVKGDFKMGGADGRNIEEAAGTLELVINDDSAKFVSLFLHYNLPPDSVFYFDEPTDFFHRKDFQFLGVILPEYKYKGDTLELTVWYEGRNYDYPLPYNEESAAVKHSLDFNIPKGFNYLMPGMGPIEEAGKGRQKFQAAPTMLFRRFYFIAYATGVDTLATVSEMGMPVNFLKFDNIDKRAGDCFIPDAIYEKAVSNSFNYMCSKLGGPLGTFGEYVYPIGFISMPGVISAPQIACVRTGSMEAVGGIDVLAGYSAARQWYGNMMRPASYREDWLAESAPHYLSMMYVEETRSGGEFYSNLVARRDTVYNTYERKRQMPLITGNRGRDDYVSNVGIWILHMLRFMMFDIETQTDTNFRKFMHELALYSNNSTFTNGDISRIAEKHYGASLTSFFDHWLCNTGIPKYKVEYTVEQNGNEWNVPVSIVTTGVPDEFVMPVMMRVETTDGSEFSRQDVAAGETSFVLGPFTEKPKELHFNEFFSVLCRKDVKKK